MTNYEPFSEDRPLYVHLPDDLADGLAYTALAKGMTLAEVYQEATTGIDPDGAPELSTAAVATYIATFAGKILQELAAEAGERIDAERELFERLASDDPDQE